GWLSDVETAARVKLSEELPPVGDIIRFMVRNTEDKDIVESFGLNKEFEQKYVGLLQKWGKAAGLTEEVVRAFWRAHWVIPAVGQLFAMFQRLRPGRVGADLQVTAQDIDR